RSRRRPLSVPGAMGTVPQWDAPGASWFDPSRLVGRIVRWGVDGKLWLRRWAQQRRHDRAGQEGHDNAEGDQDWELVDADQEHLDADEREDERQSGFQVVELPHDAGERKVERPQTEDGKDIRCVDDKRVSRDGEDGRDRVDSKDDVR